METTKSFLKPWIANLTVWVMELIIIAIYFYIGINSFGEMSSFSDLERLFDDIMSAMLFLNVAILVLAICCFVIRPLRTKNNKMVATWNIIWAVGNCILIFV